MTVSIISNGCFIKPSTGGSGGFLGLGIWRYRTAITSTPASGELQFDDTTVADATELYVHSVNDSGADMSAFLDLLSEFDLIYIQVQVDASQFVTLQIGTPSLSSSVYTFPISQIQAQGATPSDDTEVAVVIERDGVGAGVTDHGALTGLPDYDHPWALHKDITNNITVGYTTDVEPDGFANPLVPDLTLEYFKTMTVTGGFTLNVPTGGNGHCEYYLTIDSGGPYTLAAGANVTMMDANVTMEADGKYVLNIHKYSDTVVLAQLLLSGDTSGAKWNAYGNDGVGGGPFTVDDDFSIPNGKDYEVNGVHVLSRDTIYQFDVGPFNTLLDSVNSTDPNITVGYGNTSIGIRGNVSVGVNNESNAGRRAVSVGVENIAETQDSVIAGSRNTGLGGANNEIAYGYNNTVNAGIAIGISNTANNSINSFTMALGTGCLATGANCCSIGINVVNTVSNTLKIGPNNATAVVVAGNGFGVALPTGLPLARLHTGPGSATVPSIIMDVSNRLINTPAAGAIEYSSITLTKSIESIATTDPAQVTITDHLFADGSTVTVSSISDGAFTPSLINTTHEINVLDADTFELIGIECTSSPTTDTGTAVGPHQDRYIYFTHQDGTRSNVVTIHAETITSGDSPYDLPNDVSALICDVTGGNITVNLPTAESSNDRMLNIKGFKTTAGSNTLTLDPDGSETLEKELTVASSVSSTKSTWVSYQIISDGTEWWII